MDDKISKDKTFYEQFWADSNYTLRYAFDSAVRDRFPAIQKVWGELRPPSRLLDYGCGNGVLTYWMYSNRFGRDCLGIDISSTAIENARKQFARNGLEFRVFDPNKPIDDLGKFDVVVSSHVLEHVPEPRETIARILPLSEWVLIEIPLEDCLVQNTVALIRQKERKDNPLGHIHFWTKDKFRYLLESCGLLIIREYQYASAPFSPYNNKIKQLVERLALAVLGTRLYGQLMATHYIVLAYRHPSWQEIIERNKE
ncbi:MAG: class I SAM-dependent methyltransferase [Nitrospirota bacterium]